MTTTIYTPNTDNLDKVPSCDIFGFLMATAGVITKMKLKKANVDMRGSSYSVPFSMMEPK